MLALLLLLLRLQVAGELPLIATQARRLVAALIPAETKALPAAQQSLALFDAIARVIDKYLEGEGLSLACSLTVRAEVFARADVTSLQRDSNTPASAATLGTTPTMAAGGSLLSGESAGSRTRTPRSSPPRLGSGRLQPGDDARGDALSQVGVTVNVDVGGQAAGCTGGDTAATAGSLPDAAQVAPLPKVSDGGPGLQAPRCLFVSVESSAGTQDDPAKAAQLRRRMDTPAAALVAGVVGDDSDGEGGIDGAVGPSSHSVPTVPSDAGSVGSDARLSRRSDAAASLMLSSDSSDSDDDGELDGGTRQWGPGSASAMETSAHCPVSFSVHFSLFELLDDVASLAQWKPQPTA